MNEIEKSDTKLKIYDGSIIETIGKCKLKCRKGKQLYNIEFIVVQNNLQPILGLQTCIKEGFMIIPDIS